MYKCSKTGVAVIPAARSNEDGVVDNNDEGDNRIDINNPQ